VKLWQKAVADHSTEYSLWALAARDNLAQAFLMDSQPQGALQAAEATLKLDPADGGALTLRVSAYRSLGEADQALNAARVGLLAAGCWEQKSVGWLGHELFDLSLSSGDKLAAVVSAGQELSKRPDLYCQAVGWALLAPVHWLRGDLPAADNDVKLGLQAAQNPALQMPPRNSLVAMAAILNIWESRGDPAETIRTSLGQRALFFPVAWPILAVDQASQGNWRKAFLFSQGYDEFHIPPGDESYFLPMFPARTLMAETLRTQASAGDETPVEKILTRGLAEKFLGDDTAAQSAFRAALQLDPHNQFASAALQGKTLQELAQSDRDDVWAAMTDVLKLPGVSPARNPRGR
jgi:tetratricopeptide (TPR) repeat protein